MGKMIECVVDSVRVSLTNQDRVMVLKDKGSERYLPIWIGIYEAESITIALQKIAVARPLTHDLIPELLNQLGIQLVCAEITAIESDTFYADLVLEQNGERKYIDCRPSDAVAIIVRSQVPLYVDEEVFTKVGIIPEEAERGEAIELSPSTENRQEGDLSLFEDFLKSLDDDEDSSENDKPEDLPF